MIDPNDYRKSKYLKASDLTAARTKVRIGNVGKEEFGSPPELKVVLSFTTASLKPRVVGYTDLVTLVEGFGPDERTWSGKLIVLFKTKVLFQNKLVETLRIEIPPQPAASPAPAVPASGPPEIPEEILAADEEELI